MGRDANYTGCHSPFGQSSAPTRHALCWPFIGSLLQITLGTMSVVLIQASFNQHVFCSSDGLQSSHLLCFPLSFPNLTYSLFSCQHIKFFPFTKFLPVRKICYLLCSQTLYQRTSWFSRSSQDNKQCILAAYCQRCWNCSRKNIVMTFLYILHSTNYNLSKFLDLLYANSYILQH